MTGKGHPLPGSDEARHNEVPEHLERAKGLGDDARKRIQPEDEPVAPDGERYRYDDLGRGPGSGGGGGADELAEDQAAHQDRGQSAARSEGEDG